jgi:fatty-acyl-CoA synthase
MVDDHAFSHEGKVRLIERGSQGAPEARHRSLVSSGTPIHDTLVAIMDKSGRRLDDGQVGEIAIRSASIATGYYADTAATATAFRGDWYFSGDLGFLHEGELYVTGRKSDLMIVAGINLHPHELEDFVGNLPGVHPGRVVVFGVFDDQLGTERVVILLETESACTIPPDEIVASVRACVLARSGVAIHDVQVTAPQTLLKSTSGKFSRRRNRELYLARLSGMSVS